ncbi:hypothetical protein DM02DRAFT_643365 [Periconia macrospinosa]|uniref:Uncharacterized protein n=1 Tax=Periconia macrospinosa TaxID=97972 RepID=A0A2V1DL88_9PLEO|nr:hypothetical protein DM02DRAFT_643365 [Periconia macrospinosa]
MATVRDPNFWKRFSTAVHQDDLLREEANQAGLKHTYVTTISLSDDNITMSSLSPMPTPTSPTHILSSSPPKFALHPQPQLRYSGTYARTTPARPMTAGAASTRPPSSHSRSHSPQSRPRSFSHSRPLSYSYPEPAPPLPQSQPYPQRSSSRSSHTHTEPQRTTPPPLPQTTLSIVSPQISHHTTSTTTTSTTTPTRLTKPQKSLSKPANRSSIGGGGGRPRARSNPLFTRQSNNSQLTLGLSGRPQSRFKFWTSVSADPSNRNSWLESQQRKARQRTYICWGFWLALLAIIAGVVAAVLVLKSKGII